MALGVWAALRRTAGAISILFGVLYLVPGLVLLKTEGNPELVELLDGFHW